MPAGVQPYKASDCMMGSPDRDDTNPGRIAPFGPVVIHQLIPAGGPRCADIQRIMMSAPFARCSEVWAVPP
jgi:hypothetical protein